MATFKTEVLPIRVEEHPNADRLEIARVGEYRSIVQLGKFESGDLVAYIQEGSLVPEDVLRHLGLWDDGKGKGALAGSDGKRVKSVRLRGVLSQGLCYPLTRRLKCWTLQDPSGGEVVVEEGEDVSEELGIEKWEPPIPTQMAGEVWNAGGRRCIRYDIENWKRYPDVLEEGEPVVYTEKIHGTWGQMGVLPPGDGGEEPVSVSSKGLASKGLAFKQNEANSENLYLRAFYAYSIREKIEEHFQEELASGDPVFVLGEVFGLGVQQGFGYGHHAKSDDTLGFRAFDIYVGSQPRGRYLDYEEMTSALSEMGIPQVPALARTEFSVELMRELTDGPETVSTAAPGGHPHYREGEPQNIREGLVIKPERERRDPELGRVILKSVSEAYLEGDTTQFN